MNAIFGHTTSRNEALTPLDLSLARRHWVYSRRYGTPDSSLPHRFSLLDFMCGVSDFQQRPDVLAPALGIHSWIVSLALLEHVS